MNRAYFDYNATTPVSPEVLDAATGALREVFGNASSIHQWGQAARERLEHSRRQMAALLHCDPRELVLVSGGTEANNLAIFGTLRSRSIAACHVITTAIEHPAVLNVCAQLQQDGADVTYVPVDGNGVVDPDDISRAIRPHTILITVMHVNNELGTVQPVEAIARIAAAAGVTMHIDGVQAAGRIPVDLKQSGPVLYSVSGHKMYAPKGVGLLCVRESAPLQPLLFGGRHERGRRAGTENVPGAVALGCAAQWLHENLPAESPRLSGLRDRLERGILAAVPDTAINGATSQRAPNTTNMRFDGIDGEAMVIALDLRGFAVSTGSACSSGAVEPSHVLTAIGLSPDEARSSLRFSLGRFNTAEQVDSLIGAVAESAAHLRRVSTAYSHV